MANQEEIDEWNRGKIARWERHAGAGIRAERMDRGWTQADLAAKLSALGFSAMQTTVAKIEAGTRPLRIGEFVVIAEAFGMPWQSLMTRPHPLIHPDESIAAMELELAKLLELEEISRADFLKNVVSDINFLAGLRAERLAAEQRFREIRGVGDGPTADPTE